MKLLHHLYATALLLLLGICEADAQKMLLSKVKTLTLRNGEMTKGRRVEPIPQVYIHIPKASYKFQMLI
jgi:hypothetical protein